MEYLKDVSSGPNSPQLLCVRSPVDSRSEFLRGACLSLLAAAGCESDGRAVIDQRKLEEDRLE